MQPGWFEIRPGAVIYKKILNIGRIHEIIAEKIK